MAIPSSIEPLDDLVPYAAAAWSAADLPLKDSNGDVPRYLEVVAVGASPSLVLLLANGETRTYDGTNSPIAAGWRLGGDRGLKVAAIQQTTADVTTVLVGY